MSKRAVILTSVVAGLATFFIFRWFTSPLELLLHGLLLLAFVGSSLICATVFALLWERVPWRWVRLATVPLFLFGFTSLSGLGVVGATRVVYFSRSRSADAGGILYGDTSGMQMMAVDGDLWLHILIAVGLPLLLLSALGGMAAFTGIRGPQFKQHDA